MDSFRKRDKDKITDIKKAPVQGLTLYPAEGGRADKE